MLRARYSGGQGEAPSLSSTVAVEVYERASTRVSVEKSWIESIPLPVEVYVRSLDSGAPMRGVWVVLYANVSGGTVALASGQTGADGRVVYSVRLPAGVYRLHALVADPHVSTEEAEPATVSLHPPFRPVREGPYIAPIGRIVAQGTALTGPGGSAGVLFAFYYGEELVEPDSVWVEVMPEASVELDHVGDGLYIAVVTPPSTGTYTVVLHAVYNEAHYVGAGYVYSVNLTGKLEEWGSQIEATLEDLRGISDTLTTYLREINSSLKSLNVTKLVGLIEEVHGDTVLLVNTTGAIRDGIGQLLDKADRIEVLVTSTGDKILAVQGDTAKLLSSLNASIQDLKAGLLLVNTSIGTLAASLTGLNAQVEAISGDVFTIKTSLGEVTLNLENLSRALEDSTVSIGEAVDKIQEIAGLIVEIDNGVAKIIDTTGEVREVLVGDLKPQVAAVGDKIALVETRLGLMATTTDEVLKKLGAIEDASKVSGETLEDIAGKIDALAQKMDKVEEKVDKLRPEDMIARGIGGAGVLLGLLAVAIASRRR